MSIVEDGRTKIDPQLLVWTVYALVGLSVIVDLSAAASPIVVTLALAAAPLPILLAMGAPERFEVTWRGSKGFNVFLSAGVILLGFAGGSGDIPGNVALIVAGVAGAAAAGLSFLVPGRAKLASPLQFTVVLAATGAFYGFAATEAANVRLDTSAGQVMQATVSSKSVSSGRRGGTYYHLTLAPWGPFMQPTSTVVSEALYDQVDQGGHVCPTLHPGALSLPWYTVSGCAGAPTDAAGPH